MYSIDAETMLQLLRDHKRSGRLTANLPTGTLGLREPCRAIIDVIEGMVTTCRIEQGNGRPLLEGKAALRELQRLGTLDWILTFQQPVPPLRETSPVLFHPQASAASLVPIRSTALTSSQVNSLPRIHRKIYGIVDGKNSVKRIAELLSLPIETVESALRELRAMGVVA